MHVSLFQVNIALRCFLHNHDNIAKEGRDYALLLPNNFTAHSMPLNGLEHCIDTTSMTNIRPNQYLNPVALSFKPQQDRTGHRDDLVISNTNKPIRFPINVASNIYRHDK